VFTFYSFLEKIKRVWKFRKLTEFYLLVSYSKHRTVRPGLFLAHERHAWTTVTFRCPAVQQVTEVWPLSIRFLPFRLTWVWMITLPCQCNVFRCSLDDDAMKTLVHAFITSRVDCGSPHSTTDMLQHVLIAEW